MKIVILAAGFGSRLWPLSTPEQPKQFQALLDGSSLLQRTYQLASKVTQPEEIYVLTLKGLEHWVHEQIPGIGNAHVITVPERRNTLPHTLFAASSIATSDDEIILFTGTDIFVSEPAAFVDSLASFARDGDPTTISLFCNAVHEIDTNAGYVQTDTSGRVTFIEKPDRATIERMTAQNDQEVSVFASFTFAASKQSLDAALQAIPDAELKDRAKALLHAKKAERDTALLALAFCDISHALFQSAPNVSTRVVASDFIDLGTYGSLHKVSPKDDAGNVIQGTVLLEGSCSGNYIVNACEALLVVINTSDSVIIQTPAGSVASPLAAVDSIGEIYKQKIHP